MGKILSELREEISHKLPEDRLWNIDSDGKKVKKMPIRRATFYKLEIDLKFPLWDTHTKNSWRTYTRKQADIIKDKIKKKYKFFS